MAQDKTFTSTVNKLIGWSSIFNNELYAHFKNERYRYNKGKLMNYM